MFLFAIQPTTAYTLQSSNKVNLYDCPDLILVSNMNLSEKKSDSCLNLIFILVSNLSDKKSDNCLNHILFLVSNLADKNQIIVLILF